MSNRIERYCYTKSDFSIEWYSGTGPGGQRRNKVQCCCRITHIPSGLKVTSSRHRDRRANFRDAFKALGAQLKVWIKEQIKAELPQRKTSNETIRTYHYADNRVVDHASQVRIAASDLDKKFGDLITSRRLAILNAELNKDEHD